MWKKIWMFPVGVAIMIPGTFFLTYAVAVSNNHVQPWIPYISDTGSYPPESCVFAQLLNISALLVGLVMYFRHRQIVEFYRHASTSQQRFIRCSTIFLWIGYLSAFGLSMVGNFQQTAWLKMHILGAFFAFAFGLAYCWGQTVFTYRMVRVMHNRCVSHFRMALSTVATVCFCLMFGFGFNPVVEHTPGRKLLRNDCALWTLVFIDFGDDGYYEHLVTTACEWLMAFAFVTYFGSYAIELRHAILIPPKIVLTIKHSMLPKDEGYVCDSVSQDQSKRPASPRAGNLHIPGYRSALGSPNAIFTLTGMKSPRASVKLMKPPRALALTNVQAEMKKPPDLPTSPKVKK